MQNIGIVGVLFFLRIIKAILEVILYMLTIIVSFKAVQSVNIYISEGIFQILVYLIVASVIVSGILSKLKISSVKVMLFGIALIVFSNSVLKGMIKYGIDEIISVIGLNLCIIDFFKDDK